jgi:hypothetical protein
MNTGCCANLPLVGAVQATPLQVQVVLTWQDDHSAYLAAGTGQPTQVATRTLESEGGRGSAACRGEACKASTAAGESRLGSLRQRWMDL